VTWDEPPTVADWGLDDTVCDTGATPSAIGPGCMVGEYRLERLIGRGGMAQVYEATHPVTGLAVAIKLLAEVDPASIARFEQEARAVGEIGHPAIPDVYAIGELPDGRRYLVTELLAGEDLAHRLARGALGIHEVVDILEPVANALQAAHAHDIAHRDLKPDNVFLCEAGGRRSVKLLDFGIAKLVGDREGPSHTQTGLMVGTPGYMSPEQARGLELDHRTDIYSLGALAFEMLCGRLPFEGKTGMDVVLRQLSADAPAPGTIRRDTPASLSALVKRMLERNPDRRPTLAEVRGVLAKLRAARSAQLPAPTIPSDIPSLASPRAPLPPAPVRRASGTPAPVFTAPVVAPAPVVVTYRAPSKRPTTGTSLVGAMAPPRWKQVVTWAVLSGALITATALVVAALAR
jgi:serine/threonine-protein kinase